MSPRPTQPKQRAQGQLARTFPPFPPAPGRRGGFVSAWWGQAWVSALEECSLDSGRLTRGRTYARRGSVGEMTVVPGRISAPVQGSRPRPYRVSLAIPVLSDAAWDRLLDAVAARAGHIAALLDRDMPTELVKDTLKAGVRLLPSANDLQPSCSCPDWGYPCKHGAALCYQVARLLDEDPFVLLLMRGRGEQQLLDELARRNAARAASQAAASASVSVPSPRAFSPPSGTPAREAFAARADLPPLPGPPPLPERAGYPPVFEASRPAEPGIDPDALQTLAADAAERARRQLAAALANDTPPNPSDLTEWQDAVRIAAEHPQTEVFARIAESTGRPLIDLAQAVRAWSYDGTAALAVLEDPWTPDPSVLTRTRASLAEDWADGPPPQLRRWRNRFTVVGRDRQLRYGRDGRWYPYGKEDGAWWPIGQPDPDPATALAALLILQDRRS
ncbi:SWIM zinc finger family protein [Streptomyces sp. NPDC056580]|uniref:SWIM zinc finger family protein n=1 Tax=Streptomyces sp. NPDC056580 TaxID=3345872 RepID=UPI0036CC5106